MPGEELKAEAKAFSGDTSRRILEMLKSRGMTIAEALRRMDGALVGGVASELLRGKRQLRLCHVVYFAEALGVEPWQLLVDESAAPMVSLAEGLPAEGQVESTAWTPQGLNRAVADRFKALCEQRGLTQEQIVSRTNGRVGQSQVSALSRADRRWNIGHLALLSGALDVSPRELLPGAQAQPSRVAPTVLNSEERDLIEELRSHGHLSAIALLGAQMRSAAYDEGLMVGRDCERALGQARSAQEPEAGL